MISKQNFKSLFVAILFSAIGLFGVMSCTEPVVFQGNYSVTETPVNSDSAYAQVLLSVVQTEEGIKAKIALHHFIKQTFLYSDVTESNLANTDKDTLTLSFSIPADKLSLIEDEQKDRPFTMTVVKLEDQNLKLVKTTGNVLPSDTSLVLRNVTESDPKFSIGSRKPNFIVFQEAAFLYAFWGKVKTIRIKGYRKDYYTFDENGIPTGSNQYSGFHRQTEANGTTVVSTKYQHDVSGYKTTDVYDKDNRLIKNKWTAYNGQGYGDYCYDQHGRLTMRKDNDGQIRTLIFDKNGKMIYSDCKSEGYEPYVDEGLKDLTIDEHGNWLPKNWELEYYE